MPKNSTPKTAEQFLHQAAELMARRGQQYDKPGGERSAPKIAKAYNAITGRDLAASDIWLILLLLKAVRQHQGAAFHPDSAEDLVAYAALLAESQRAEPN